MINNIETQRRLAEIRLNNSGSVNIHRSLLEMDTCLICSDHLFPFDKIKICKNKHIFHEDCFNNIKKVDNHLCALCNE